MTVYLSKIVNILSLEKHFLPLYNAIVINRENKGAGGPAEYGKGR